MATYTLTGDLSGLVGELRAPLEAWVVPYSPAVEDSGTVRIGSAAIPLDLTDGSFAVELPAQYYTVRVRFYDSAQASLSTWDSALFELASATDLADLIPAGPFLDPVITMDDIEDILALDLSRYVVQVNAPVGVAATDTANVQSALTAAASGGGTVLLQRGNYKINATLTVATGVTLAGQGLGTTLVMDGAWTVPTLGVVSARNATDVVIRDFQIDGQRATKGPANVNAAVAVAGCSRVRISGLYVIDPMYCGILVAGIPAGLTDDVSVTGCTVYRGGTGVLGPISNGISTDATDGPCRNVRIIGNHVKETTDCGIGIHDDSQFVTVANNTIDSVGAAGIDIAGCQFITVTGNTIRYPGQTAPGSAAGIRIVFDKSTYSSQDFIVNGNVILGNSTGNGVIGIFLHSISGSAVNNRFQIAHNIIRNMTTAAGYGMYLSVQGAYIQVDGNTISAATNSGIAVDGVLISDFQITNNVIVGNGGNGVHLQGTIGAGKVQNNTLAANGAGTNASAAQKAALQWFGNGPQDLSSALPNGTTGFYGTAPVAKPAAPTATVAAAPAGGTGTAAGGWDTAANRNLAITTINNTKTRLDEVVTKLQALGLLS
jgi:hypothetical protein